jgi:hypothetical protein
MSGRPDLCEALARVLCDAWFAACERPDRWPGAREEQRATFRAMAAFALAAARQGRRSEWQLAEALCRGFWQGAPIPRLWSAHGRQQREIFLICARRMLAAGRELRSQRLAAPLEKAA